MMRSAGQNPMICADAASAPASASARTVRFVPASDMAVWAVSFFVFLRMPVLCSSHIWMPVLLLAPILPGVLPVLKKFISTQRG